MSTDDPLEDTNPETTSHGESWVFDEVPHNALTPMGQVDSVGAFARGLGPRRVKMIVAAGAVVALVMALVTTVG